MYNMFNSGEAPEEEAVPEEETTVEVETETEVSINYDK
jgi:hypothetical protein